MSISLLSVLICLEILYHLEVVGSLVVGTLLVAQIQEAALLVQEIPQAAHPESQLLGIPAHPHPQPALEVLDLRLSLLVSRSQALPASPWERHPHLAHSSLTWRMDPMVVVPRLSTTRLLHLG
jgi:hypothetical protein